MGFYGNITNTSKTTFQFDRIYSNRAEMDARKNTDGVFVGRYVLVEYETNANYPNAYIKASDKALNTGVTLYTSPGCEKETEVKFGGSVIPTEKLESDDRIYLGEFVQVQEIKANATTKLDDIISVTFYKCVGGTVDKPAIFNKIVKTESTVPYIQNFSIDEQQYNHTDKKNTNYKGYDSTVWVKVSKETGGSLYTDYVNIADLNSVVPSFDLATDAPSMSPITPHFDADSTNVYYKLHVQPSYGLRVGAAEKNGKSDEKTYWTREYYNKDTNIASQQYWDGSKWVTPDDSDKDISEVATKFAADIYYNYDAFNAQVGKSIIKKKDNDTKDKISILPTGKSGETYYDHETKSYVTKPDTQEIRINLPSIGNMMSEAWDIIHGPNRDDARTDENGSLQGRLDSFKYMANNQIPVKRRSDGTFVGTNINGAKQREVTAILEEPLLTKDFSQDDAWIRTEIKSDNLIDGQGKETDNNGISIHHTWHQGSDTTSRSDVNGKGDTFNIITPIADKAGHIVAHNTETVTLPYSFKEVGIGEQSEVTGNPETNTTTIIADNTQDKFTLNSSNKWIRMSAIDDTTNVINIGHEVHTITTTDNGSTNLNEEPEANIEDNINIPDWTYDSAGHITSKQNHKYTLPFSFKTIQVPENSVAVTAPLSSAGAQTADKTQDILNLASSNKWINLDAATDDTIKFGHVLSGIANKTHTSSDTKITNFGDTFKILNFTTDEAGHITNVGETTIETPQGSINANVTETNGSVITGLQFDPITGAITQQNKNVGTRLLTEYTSGTDGALKINSSNSINGAFQSVQSYINELDYEDNDTTQFITKIKQVDGQISTTRGKAGTLVVGSKPNVIGTTITNTDTITSVIEKLETRIKTEEDNRKAAINALYGDDISNIAQAFDTIKEIADWLDGDESTGESGVEKITGDISKLQDLVGDTSVSTQITNAINKLDKTNSANSGYYISSVNQTDGLVSIGTTKLPTYTLSTGSANGTVKLNNTEVAVKGLGTAAYTAVENYATAAQGSKANSAVQPTTTFTYGSETKTIQQLMTIVNVQVDTIKKLEDRITALETPSGE